MDQIVLRPIGSVSSPRNEVVDDFWGNVISTIKLDGSLVSPESIQGLTDSSHIMVVYYLHKNCR
jgi:tRNA (Thr-GGU) A37 N-methylase